MQIGTLVRINNPLSSFHGRIGILARYVWPYMPNSAVLIRLIPGDNGPTLPCHLDELELLDHEVPQQTKEM